MDDIVRLPAGSFEERSHVLLSLALCGSTPIIDKLSFVFSLGEPVEKLMSLHIRPCEPWPAGYRVDEEKPTPQVAITQGRNKEDQGTQLIGELLWLDKSGEG